MLELPISFFKVDRDNLTRHKYAGKLFDFSWIPEVRQISSSKTTILQKKDE